jgi:hypothetical protein
MAPCPTLKKFQEKNDYLNNDGGLGQMSLLHQKQDLVQIDFGMENDNQNGSLFL